ncbi:MAG: hypothetical protein ACOC91_00125 [bacterium]
MTQALAQKESAPPVLLPYQQQLARLIDETRLVADKSRRIGFSWTCAEVAVETSSLSRAAGGMDTLYIGYNLDMAREFIDAAAFWAGHMHGYAAEAGEFVFDDEDRDIKAFRISFASGFEIIALSSRPRSLRGRQGFVIIDEAAFHEDLPGLLKAAMAMLMWGGKVWVISTHNGADHPFNDLVEDARAGRKPFKHIRVTFQQAVADGLYKRICLVRGQEWTPKKEKAWVAEMYDSYGEDAAEELDVIPSQGTGVWLSGATIEQCMVQGLPVIWHNFETGYELKPLDRRDAFISEWIRDHLEPVLAGLDWEALSFLGGDIARSGDLSVYKPGQLSGDNILRVPFIIELRNAPFREQEAVLRYLIDRLPNFQKAALDARGLGAGIVERVQDHYGADLIEAVLATVEWYREVMPGYKERFEDQTIRLPKDHDVKQDHRLVTLDKGVAKVPEGKHIRNSRGGWRHGDAAIAGAMLHFATTADPVTYDGYKSAGRRAVLDDHETRPGMRPPSDDEPAGRFGKGAW